MKWINGLERLPQFEQGKKIYSAKYMGFYGCCYRSPVPHPKPSIYFEGVNYKGYVYPDSFKDFYWLDETPVSAPDIREEELWEEKYLAAKKVLDSFPRNALEDQAGEDFLDYENLINL